MARVLVSSDHAGVETRAAICQTLRALGHDAVDMGPTGSAPVDYPGFAHALGRAVVNGEADWGVLVCGSGIGMSIAANKIAGVRAALANDPYSARMAREHNDANVLVVGARVIGPEMIREVVQAFAAASFTPGDDGRHRRRVEQIEPVA